MKNTIIKVLVAGAVAGIIATGVKTVWEKGFPARAESTDSPPLILADRAKQEIGEGKLTEQQKPPLETTIHWTFGITVCLIYSLFGGKISAGEIGLRAFVRRCIIRRNSRKRFARTRYRAVVFENKPEYALSEFGSHLAFGATAEIVRSFISKKLD